MHIHAGNLPEIGGASLERVPRHAEPVRSPGRGGGVGTNFMAFLPDGTMVIAGVSSEASRNETLMKRDESSRRCLRRTHRHTAPGRIPREPARAPAQIS